MVIGNRLKELRESKELSPATYIVGSLLPAPC
jgi:hypothetical protein